MGEMSPPAILLAFSSKRNCFLDLSSSYSTRSNRGKYFAPHCSTKLAVFINASSHAAMGICSCSAYSRITGQAKLLGLLLLVAFSNALSTDQLFILITLSIRVRAFNPLMNIFEIKSLTLSFLV